MILTKRRDKNRIALACDVAILETVKALDDGAASAMRLVDLGPETHLKTGEGVEFVLYIKAIRFDPAKLAADPESGGLLAEL